VDRPIASADAQGQYDRIAAQVSDAAGAKPGQMMGMPTLFLGGKAFAGLFGDSMVFKLEGEAHAAALALPGAMLFDPSGMGRPMKAWVRVPLDQVSAWSRLTASGAQGVGNTS
jgi:hypothetical protein